MLILLKLGRWSVAAPPAPAVPGPLMGVHWSNLSDATGAVTASIPLLLSLGPHRRQQISQYTLGPHSMPSDLTVHPRTSQYALGPHSTPSDLTVHPRTSQYALGPHSTPSDLTVHPVCGPQAADRRTSQYTLGSHSTPSDLTVLPRISQYTLEPHSTPSDLTVHPRISQYTLRPHSTPSDLTVHPRISQYTLRPHSTPSDLTVHPRTSQYTFGPHSTPSDLTVRPRTSQYALRPHSTPCLWPAGCRFWRRSRTRTTPPSPTWCCVGTRAGSPSATSRVSSAPWPPPCSPPSKVGHGSKVEGQALVYPGVTMVESSLEK